jgi:hypothetical protein
MRWTLLGVVLLVAVALRITALDFGAPGVTVRPDERGVLATIAAMEQGRFFPPLVLYGGGYFHPLLWFVRGWGAVFWDGGLAARVAAADVDGLRLAVRAWSALLGLATVALVYAIGRRLRGERVGLLAAALLAVAPLAVREAHFAKADTAATAVAALVMGAFVLPRGHGWPRSVFVGASTGLALSTKMLASVVPAAAFALAWPDDRPGLRIHWRALAWGGVTCALALVALNLFALREPAVAAATARQMVHALSDAGWLPGADQVPGPFVYHAMVSLRWGCGLVIGLLAVPALAFGLQQGGGLRPIALLALGHWTALLASPMVLARFFLPALPALVVLIAALLVAAIDRAIASERHRRVALAVVAVLALAEPALASLTLVRLLGRTDTRSLAAAWISTHLPPDARIVSWGAPRARWNFGRPPLGGRSEVIGLSPERWRAKGMTVVVWHHYPLPYSSEALPRGGAGLHRLAIFDPFTPGASPRPVLEPLDAFYLPLGRFAGVERPGPRIEVLAIDPAPSIDAAEPRL